MTESDISQALAALTPEAERRVIEAARDIRWPKCPTCKGKGCIGWSDVDARGFGGGGAGTCGECHGSGRVGLRLEVRG